MNLSTEHRELLSQIQSLALSGYEQTGIHICHSVTIGSYGIDSTVQFMTSDTSTLHATTSEYLWDYATLEQQRDELARWIVQNRKGEAA